MAQDTATFWEEVSGLTSLVLVVFSNDGQIVNAATGALISLSAANVPNAAIAMTDAGHANHYQAAYPPANTPAGRYAAVVYRQAGAALALSDEPQSQPAEFVWDGANVTLLSGGDELVLSALAAMIFSPGGQPQFTQSALQRIVPLLLGSDRTIYNDPDTIGEAINESGSGLTAPQEAKIDKLIELAQT
jgi:hypothetical protein